MADGVAALAAAEPVLRHVLRIAHADTPALGDAIAAALAGPINTARAISDGDGRALRLGPDEWLLLSPADSLLVEGAKAAARNGAVMSLVETTDASVGLRLAGPRVEDVLAVGCPLPLSLAAFPVGKATRTLLAKAGIVLERRGEHEFHIEVPASLAPYAVALLAVAIADEAAIRRAS
jgi:sarcosine oxidase subunit gamma